MFICSMLLWGNKISQYISYNFIQRSTIKSTLMKHLNTHNYLGKCLEASWSCSAVSTCRIVQNICGVCVQSKTGCTFVETKGWPRRRKGNKKIAYLVAIERIKYNCMAICTFNNHIIFIFQKSLSEVGNLGLPRDIGLQIRWSEMPCVWPWLWSPIPNIFSQGK